MKFLTSVLMVLMTFTSCVAQTKKTKNEGVMSEKKILVAYYSATGTTKAVAEAMGKAINAEVYEIEPAEKYTDADLNWRNKQSRSSVEMHDDASRPKLGGKAIDASAYEIVFVGFPNWWNLPPRVINSWVESQKLDGKVVIPFSTSGGSGIENSVKSLRSLYPNIKWKDGKMLNCSYSEASKWAAEMVK